MTEDKDFVLLIERASAVQGNRQLSRGAEAGGVGAALLTDKGNIYTGVCIDTPCSMGFCAEHAAAAAMVTAGESQIVKLVAVGNEGIPVPPCGRCREFLVQLDDDNRFCQVLLPDGSVRTLKELLPYMWNEPKEGDA